MDAAVKLGACAFGDLTATGCGASDCSCCQDAVSNHHPAVSKLSADLGGVQEGNRLKDRGSGVRCRTTRIRTGACPCGTLLVPTRWFPSCTSQVVRAIRVVRAVEPRGDALGREARGTSTGAQHA